MTEIENILMYKDSLILLTLAGIVVPFMLRMKINSVIGFLMAGTLLGPHGIGAFASEYPFLHYITILDKQGVSLLGDLGIVFLLFLIGVELSVQRLITMRKLVFRLGGLQTIVSTIVIMGIALLCGVNDS